MINIVLYEPEIPQNTGNIMRTAVAAGARLHLVGELGFILDSKKVKRSVMDYESSLDLKRHVDWDDFVDQEKGQYFFLSRFASKTYSDFDYQSIEEDIYLIFGGESQGLPQEIKDAYQDELLRIPMVENARSMNLSNTVALVTYEVLRQKDFLGLSKINQAQD
ncbi:tRNA (cytidine(34)-2'-O)-methyltransferase [Erysipelothrix urinaevulpis]|uniref:tRNA (cytidine(34)-2'-O)-methyltransferase n=1 Tax=Erysipelothrix urinaevulpis TaxID=2683717 RepID=UPI00135CA65A|nr:tRNA (cytidine(34)-2'-O)-methyltransferase [Erysipelothrix urinaevulpis]